MFVANTLHSKDTKTTALVRKSIIKTNMILGILVAVTVISCPVHWSLPEADREYTLIHYTKLISEETSLVLCCHNRMKAQLMRK